MRRYVEDHPAVDIGQLKRAGAFDGAGRLTIHLGNDVRWLTFDLVTSQLRVIETNGDSEVFCETIAVVFVPIKLGFRPYFLCPVSEARCTKLYLVDGQLASRSAHGLGFRSKIGREDERAKARTERLVQRIDGVAGKGASRGAKRQRLLDQLQTLTSAYSLNDRARQLLRERTSVDADLPSPTLRPGRYFECSPEAQTTDGQRFHGYGVAGLLRAHIQSIQAGAPRHDDVDVITDTWDWKPCSDRIRALGPKPSFDHDGTPLLDTYGIWRPPHLTGGCTGVAMGLFAETPNRAWLVIRSIYDGRPRSQTVRAVRDWLGTWAFICPITQARSSVLYARRGYWAAPKGLHLTFDDQTYGPDAFAGQVRRWSEPC